MNRLLLSAVALFVVAAAGCAEQKSRNEPAHLLPKAGLFPLQLDDNVQFRKTEIFLNDPTTWKPTQEDMISFDRLRVNHGAVTVYDRLQRYGQYYTFMWRTKRPAELTLRFEYRQEKLGNFVQAQERVYPAAKGSYTSKFNVIGDDYTTDGKVTSWRAILIENGKIVALNQSYLWR